MKKWIIAGLIMILSASLFGCDIPNGEDPEDPGELKLVDYFPMEENTRYVYEGEGNEYASYDVYVDYLFEDRMQQRKNNGGTVVAEVVQLSEDGSLATIYSRGEAYYREDFLRNETLMIDVEKKAEVLLKEPIAEGTTWTLKDGRVRTITGTAVDVEVPYGQFEAIEVKTEGDEYENFDYYAKDVGHIKSVFKTEAGDEISSSLEKLEKDVVFTHKINFYYPNLDEEKLYFKTTDVEFRTNDISRKTLEKVYKESAGIDLGSLVLGPVFTENTKINYLYLGKDNMVYIDLNRAFLDEMNAGAQYEMMILQSLANTFGQYYGVERVYLTMDGKPYESGHIAFEKGEYLKVDYENSVKIN